MRIIVCSLLAFISFLPTKVHSQAAKVAPATPSVKVSQAVSPVRKTIHLEELQRDYEIIGPLGRPIQEVLTVVLELSEQHLKGDALTMVNVHRVNGFALPQPVRIAASKWRWAKPLPQMQPGQLYELRAYQELFYSGFPPDQALQENNVGTPQSGGPSLKAHLELIGPVVKQDMAK